jgi:hypothetical protein
MSNIPCFNKNCLEYRFCLLMCLINALYFMYNMKVNRCVQFDCYGASCHGARTKK